MSIYSIILIIISLAYSSSKILNVASYFFQYKDRIISQKPDPYVIEEFGMNLFKNVLKLGLFCFGTYALNQSIANENWSAVVLLITVFSIAIPIELTD